MSRIVDIGLIGIDERLLKNRLHLSGRDQKEYQRHIEIGREIISGIDTLAFMEPLYLQVYRKYGEQPDAALPGCVLAAVTAFDDIAFERGEMEGIRDWLGRQKKRFCPEVVNAMLAVTAENSGNSGGRAARFLLQRGGAGGHDSPSSGHKLRLKRTGGYISIAKKEAKITVKRPETATARPLIAPCTSPISSALAVPRACEDAPMARPCAAGSVMRSARQSPLAVTLPIMPVRIMTATVMQEIRPAPPKCIAMAVVIDLGSSVTYCPCVSPNRCASAKMPAALLTTPASRLAATAFQYFFSSESCL